ncbi:MAG TPA: hypothetical protein PLD84_05880 [Chitinophagales bacterium]|nr:hypothetical protein [Chitinophagales bacterium]
MKKSGNSILQVLAMLTLIFLSSCATQKVAVQPEHPQVIEKISLGPTYVLRGPEWRWDRTQKTYIYVAPDYVVRQQGGVWVRGHWKDVRGGKKWVPGHWK